MKRKVLYTSFILPLKGVKMFTKNAIFLFVVSALLIPLIFATTEIISLGTLVFLFIIAQAALIYIFYQESEAALEQWYAFWSALLGLGFMLLLVITGKSLLAEFLGLILFLIYFIGLLILLFKGRLRLKAREPRREKKEKPRDEELESFRKKDELQELVDFFEPGSAKKDFKIIDIEEPKIEKIVYDRLDEEEPEKAEKDEESWELPEEILYEEEKRKEIEELEAELPKSIIFDYDAERLREKEEPKVRELKEAPRINLEKVKKDLDRIDDGVKNLSEKIKLISEKAILEGAEKKLRELEKKRQPKPKKKELKVFASKSGNKFHYNRNCLGLRRVKNKDMLAFTNSEEARRKGLKACNMCK
jgi:hypothetical protein